MKKILLLIMYFSYFVCSTSFAHYIRHNILAENYNQEGDYAAVTFETLSDNCIVSLVKKDELGQTHEVAQSMYCKNPEQREHALAVFNNITLEHNLNLIKIEAHNLNVEDTLDNGAFHE